MQWSYRAMEHQASSVELLSYRDILRVIETRAIEISSVELLLSSDYQARPQATAEVSPPKF
ncbi:hypothetical protein SAMN05428962_5716 [Paenibacillus sp. BC26]|nr:hypothetical protein SAMN05428962_5716 [Paenibacillus sp. BC26]